MIWLADPAIWAPVHTFQAADENVPFVMARAFCWRESTGAASERYEWALQLEGVELDHAMLSDAVTPAAAAKRCILLLKVCSRGSGPARTAIRYQDAVGRYDRGLVGLHLHQLH